MNSESHTFDEKQKSPTLKGVAITGVLSALTGAIPTAIMASSENGYVAGFVVLPLLLLELVLCILLLVAAVVFIAKNKFAVGLYLILSVPLIPACTIGSALAAKHFEVGVYRVSPIEPWTVK